MSTLVVDTLKDSAQTVSVDVKDILTADSLYTLSYTADETGAVSRELGGKLGDIVSVLDFGVVGDGATDDTSAFQAALDSGVGSLYIPGDVNIYLEDTVTLPATSFKLWGDGTISGTADPLVKFATTPDSGYPITEIDGVTFAPTPDGVTMLDMTSVWTTAGKPPHVVQNCTFKYSGLSQTALLLSGIWAARITGNTFIGAGTVDAKAYETGYGIRISLGNDINTSVMNLQIENNTFTVLARPIYIPARSLLTGGRCEGVKIVGNNIVNGISGIELYQCLAVSITGNQVSDFGNAITLVGCFDCAVTGNGEITGDTNCIQIQSKSDSFSERLTISGNNINSQKTGGVAIRLSNTDGTSMIRNLTINGNSIRGDGTTADTSYGVFYAGSYAISDVAISGNVFSDVDFGIFFGGISTDGANTGTRIGKNAYILKSGGIAVRFPERMSPTHYYQHNATGVFSATAGQSTVSIDVTSAGFIATPVYAELVLSTATTVRAVYSFDSSSSTTLVFNIVGTISAGSQRYCVASTGISSYGY